MIKKSIGIILLVLFIITFPSGQNIYAKDASSSVTTEEQTPKAKTTPASTAQEEQNLKAKNAPASTTQKEQTPKAKTTQASTAQKEAAVSAITTQVNVMNTDLTELKNQVNAANTEISEMKNQINDIKKRLDLLVAAVSQLEETNASINTEAGGYALVRTKFGSFAVTSDGYSQYIDGYKIKLKVGNLTSANFKDARLIVYWDQQSASTGNSVKKNLIFYIPKELASGKYTDVEVILTPASLEDIKTIQVGLELNELSLKK